MDERGILVPLFLQCHSLFPSFSILHFSLSSALLIFFYLLPFFLFSKRQETAENVPKGLSLSKNKNSSKQDVFVANSDIDGPDRPTCMSAQSDQDLYCLYIETHEYMVLHCTVPFIIPSSSSSYDLSNIERDVKCQIIIMICI